MRELPTGTVTLLFTDIEGSTRLLQQVGHRYDGILTACRQLLRAAFHRWSGIPIVLTGFTGSLMVISVNAWMNHPGGFRLHGGKVVDVDP